jgi:hypothetical protein
VDALIGLSVLTATAAAFEAAAAPKKTELELIQSQVAQKPMLRGDLGAREIKTGRPGEHLRRGHVRPSSPQLYSNCFMFTARVSRSLLLAAL